MLTVIFKSLHKQYRLEKMAPLSKLNPEAPEFYPSWYYPQLPVFPPPPGAIQQGEEHLIVSNLPYSMIGDEIIKFFQAAVGPVKSVGLFADENFCYSGKARIAFCNPADARRALLMLNDTFLYGRRMKIKLFVNDRRVFPNELHLVEQFQPSEFRPNVVENHPQLPVFPAPAGAIQPGEEHLLVSNLPYSMIGDDVIKFFQATVGPVKSVGLFADKDFCYTGKARIAFCNPGDALKAMQMLNETFLNGRRMKIKLFVNDCRVFPTPVNI
jgi:RNA recognition motif-containing protein